jgi:hypothetical protein
MERLHPVLKGGRQFACGAAELFEQKGAKAGIGSIDLDGVDEFLAI